MPRLSPSRIGLLAVVVCLAVAPGAGFVPAPRQREGLQLVPGRAAALRQDVRVALQRARELASMTAVAGADGLRRDAVLELQPGDLLTASALASELLDVTFKNDKIKITGLPLPQQFVPRGIDVSPAGLVAIAAVSQVLLYDTLTGELRVITEPEGKSSKFGFAADVAFDRQGNLIIADMGQEPLGREPADGRVWQLEPTDGVITRLAANRPLSNPKLVVVDSQDRVLLVDGEGGVPIAGLVEGHFDVLYRLKGKRRAGTKTIFRDPGLQATAFDLDEEGRAWFGMVGDVVYLEDGTLWYPCPIPPPFTFVTGIVALAGGKALVVDGVDQVAAARTIWDVDTDCVAAANVQGRRIDGARGLARFVPERD